MRLKLDENLGKELTQILRAAGHDVATVHEQSLSGICDAHLIQICTDERLHRAAENLPHADVAGAEWWLGMMTCPGGDRAVGAVRVLLEAVQ